MAIAAVIYNISPCILLSCTLQTVVLPKPSEFDPKNVSVASIADAKLGDINDAFQKSRAAKFRQSSPSAAKNAQTSAWCIQGYQSSLLYLSPPPAMNLLNYH